MYLNVNGGVPKKLNLISVRSPSRMSSTLLSTCTRGIGRIVFSMSTDV